MEGVLNYADIIFMYRAFDYSGRALLRVCHDVRFFAILVEKNKDGEKKQLRMMAKFVNDVMALNANFGATGAAPVTYKQAMKKAKQALAGEGISDSNLFSGDAYTAARGGEDKQKRSSEDRRDRDRDRLASRDSRGERHGRVRQEDRRGRDTKDHIGLFCGNWNNGGDCDERRCTRRHRCSRITNGTFCGEAHRSFEH